MYVPAFYLIEIDKPLTEEEIDENMQELNDILADDPCIYYAMEHVGRIDSNCLLNFYDGNVFELVSEDKEKGIHHIYRIRKGAIAHIGKEKLDKLQEILKKTTPENFYQNYRDMQKAVVNETNAYICDFDRSYLLDEWLFRCAKEDSMYQIEQIYDAYI